MAEFCKKCSHKHGFPFTGLYPGEVCEGCGVMGNDAPVSFWVWVKGLFGCGYRS